MVILDGRGDRLFQRFTPDCRSRVSSVVKHAYERAQRSIHEVRVVSETRVTTSDRTRWRQILADRRETIGVWLGWIAQVKVRIKVLDSVDLGLHARLR